MAGIAIFCAILLVISIVILSFYWYGTVISPLFYPGIEITFTPQINQGKTFYLVSAQRLYLGQAAYLGIDSTNGQAFKFYNATDDLTYAKWNWDTNYQCFDLENISSCVQGSDPTNQYYIQSESNPFYCKCCLNEPSKPCQSTEDNVRKYGVAFYMCSYCGEGGAGSKYSSVSFKNVATGSFLGHHDTIPVGDSPTTWAPGYPVKGNVFTSLWLDQAVLANFSPSLNMSYTIFIKNIPVDKGNPNLYVLSSRLGTNGTIIGSNTPDDSCAYYIQYASTT